MTATRAQVQAKSKYAQQAKKPKDEFSDGDDNGFEQEFEKGRKAPSVARLAQQQPPKQPTQTPPTQAGSPPEMAGERPQRPASQTPRPANQPPPNRQRGGGLKIPMRIPRAPLSGGQEQEQENEPEDLKNKREYSEEVQLRLFNLAYDPIAMDLFKAAGINSDEAHLLGLTRINSSREAWHWSVQIAKEALYNKYTKRLRCKWPISRILRVSFLLARRSIPGDCGPGFMKIIDAAVEQNITKQDAAAEQADW